ncbi:hypothetical protein SAMN05660297_02913 [Natronincola peptidivorans]|uniref:DUF4179 domain-containing protein n=1 Tax=Natronincola peptidivorans TaxID=426128 RepID=A0A1I0FRH6_9FIRM|nr:hypothetical protein [Natronincola peptidivorans]SET61016.1 hypothetical protein SAMN05660297_02913 [Natronincola peptidivorans]
MKYDSDERIIQNALNSIHTPQHDIMANIKSEIQPSKSSMNYKKVVTITLAAVFCFMLSIGVAATNIPAVNNILYVISPEIASMLQPINATSEDQGIRMEVIGAINDDEMAVVYVTMQDLTGDRIDESLDLYDYSIRGARAFTHEVVDYDKESNIATIRIQGNGGKELNGKRVQFSIASFLSHKEWFDAVDTSINPLEVKNVTIAKTIPFNLDGAGGGGMLLPELKEQGIKTINLLKTDEMERFLPGIDFMHISNIGYIDGRLHIQTKWREDSIDDHGFFYLVDALGNRLETDNSNLYFDIDRRGKTKFGRRYVEYIYDVENLDLDGVQLKGYFVTNGKYVKGNWRTSFVMESVVEEKKAESFIEFDTWTANYISVSPLGVTIAGIAEEINLDNITIEVYMLDGSIKTFDSVVACRENKEARIKFITTMPLEVSEVDYVTVNGKVVVFK